MARLFGSRNPEDMEAARQDDLAASATTSTSSPLAAEGGAPGARGRGLHGSQSASSHRSNVEPNGLSL
jgi:hypothetical protein